MLNSSAAALSSTKTELAHSKAVISNLQLKVQSTPRQTTAPKVDFSEIERANKAAHDKEQLETLLHQRTDELEQCLSDLNVVEQTCNMLEAEKNELLEELETARDLFERREQEF